MKKIFISLMCAISLMAQADDNYNQTSTTSP